LALHFTRSALRHGISQERSRYVIEHCASPIYSPDDEVTGVILFLGLDDRGVPLEVVGVEVSGGDLLVFHAMRMRNRYFEEHVRLMP
jgi:hypothetical protein